MSLEYRKGGCFSRVHRLKPVKSWHRAFLHVSRARHGKTIWTHAMTRKSANSTFPLYDMEFMQQKPGAAAAALLSCLLPFRAYFLRGSRPKGRWENKNPSPLQHSFISRIILPPHKSKTLSRQVGNGSVCNWDSPRPERFAQGTLKKAKCDFYKNWQWLSSTCAKSLTGPSMTRQNCALKSHRSLSSAMVSSKWSNCFIF